MEAAAAAKNTSASQTKTTDSTDEKRLRLIAEFDAIHPQLRASTSWKSTDSDSEMGSNSSISARQNIGMVVIVYGSATLVYVQIMLLAACLQTAATPPGLIFLVTSLGYIAYIVFKVCLQFCFHWNHFESMIWFKIIFLRFFSENFNFKTIFALNSRWVLPKSNQKMRNSRWKTNRRINLVIYLPKPMADWVDWADRRRGASSTSTTKH